MEKTLKIITGLAGALFALIGLGWVIKPAAIAAEIGLPLLEGTALNTQIGDMGAFFFAGGVITLLGVLTGKRQWYYAAALLIGSAGVFRVLAFTVQGATLPIDKLIVEIVVLGILLASAKLTSVPQ